MEEVDIFDELFAKPEKAQKESEKVEATNVPEKKEKAPEDHMKVRCDECGGYGATFSPYYKKKMCVSCWF